MNCFILYAFLNFIKENANVFYLLQKTEKLEYLGFQVN